MALEDKTFTLRGQCAAVPLSIRKTLVKSLATKKTVSMETFWTERTAVILFLRDFASQGCRLGALKINGIRSALEAHDVAVLVVGGEETGSRDFVAREFFSGDIYTVDKTAKFDPLALLSSLFVESKSHVSSEGKADITLPDYEYGGVLVVCKGGDRVLLDHHQTSLADHISNHTILKTLVISQYVAHISSPCTCYSSGPSHWFKGLAGDAPPPGGVPYEFLYNGYAPHTPESVSSSQQRENSHFVRIIVITIIS